MLSRETGLTPASVVLASFFKKLETIDFITRIIISHARISALMTFRGRPEKRVLLDYTKTPGRILVDGEAREAHISVTIRDEVMHEILAGRMAPGVAVGRREMLLKGSAADLSKFIPLFEFAPMLYREHLAGLGAPGNPLHSGLGRPSEVAMDKEQCKGDPIPLVQLSPFEKTVFALMNGLSYGLGYLVGLMRYRLFKKMNLFSVLSFMSRGLAAAAPRQEPESESPGR